MKILRRIIKGFKKPKVALFWLWWKSSRFIPSDKLYLKVYYYLKMGEKLNLENPKTFNQKIQWLKLNNTNPRYMQMVDKYAVRELIKNEIGEEYLIPLLGAWKSFDEIDFDKLPDQFVLKANHDSGSVVICKDKSSFDFNAAKSKLTKKLKQNYFYSGREMPYKQVKPIIIAEKYMVDESGSELKDYKFFCFNGEPKVMFVASDRFADIKFDFYDMDFNWLPFSTGIHLTTQKKIVKTEAHKRMINLSAKLSQGIPHVRVDFYNINGKIYFGEFTFHHDGGIVKFYPEEWDRKLGDMIVLPFEKIN
jgi:hypothetical protein